MFYIYSHVNQCIQWHASIGILYGHAYALICKLTKLNLNNIEIFISYFLPLIFFVLLLLHGDIESNRGPKKKEQTYFSLCHWNVISLAAHNKISLLAAYNSVSTDTTFVFDIFQIQSSSGDGNTLHMEAYRYNYDQIRADHPDDRKSGGVCFKEN